MKRSEIKVGHYYQAKVNDNLTIVKVDDIREGRHGGVSYDVTNTTTGRKTVFRSSMKFRAASKGPVMPKVGETSKQPEKPSEAFKAAAKIESETPITVGAQLSLAYRLKAATVQHPPHEVVIAYAGTGKTFTQIVGVGWAFGSKVWSKVVDGIWRMIPEKDRPPRESFDVVPSPEQQAVWDSIKLSADAGAKTVAYCAFNKAIVVEFGEKWGWLVSLLSVECGVTLTFSTINSLGARTVNAAYGRLNCTDSHTSNMLAAHLGRDIRDLRRYEPVLVSAVCSLVSYAKLSLSGWTEGKGFNIDDVDDDELDQLASHYDVETNGNRARIYAIVRKLLEKSLLVEGEIDFDDQNWLPIVQGLPVSTVDLLMVDEGQDLNRCKQHFCLAVGKRILLVGDTYQAIYGFAGADVDSIPNMMQKLKVTKPLKLTETRRCGKAIVREAQRYVKDFKAHASNCEGLIRSIDVNRFAPEVEDGDMILCRVNAPLVSQALKFVRDGRKVVVQGRKFGESLVGFVSRMKADSVADLLDKAHDWAEKEIQKEIAKKNPNEARIEGIGDRVACVEAFAEGADTIQQIVDKIRQVFAGKRCPQCGKSYNEELIDCWTCKCRLVTPKGINFSSVHRAKGREANRVFILRVKGAEMPSPMAKTAWQRNQEYNLIYVAITRAIRELTYVTGEMGGIGGESHATGHRGAQQVLDSIAMKHEHYRGEDE